jgi:hypothetical protein
MYVKGNVHQSEFTDVTVIRVFTFMFWVIALFVQFWVPRIMISRLMFSSSNLVDLVNFLDFQRQ